MSLTSTLNISCSCNECRTFLLSTNTPPSAFPPAAKTKTKTPTPSRIDKLSLSAYNMPPMTAIEPSKRLRLVTAPSTKSSSSSSSSNKSSAVRSAFPKTPGTLRCTHADCRARIPISWSLVAAGGTSLCEDHGNVFFDAQEEFSGVQDDDVRFSGSLAEERLSFSGGSSGKARRSGLGTRSSSATSWGSAESWDGDQRVEGNKEESKWDAGAFDSKLWW